MSTFSSLQSDPQLLPVTTLPDTGDIPLFLIVLTILPVFSQRESSVRQLIIPKTSLTLHETTSSTHTTGATTNQRSSKERQFAYRQ